MPTLYTRKSFLSVEYPLDRADVCFLSIPFDSTSTGFNTSKLGPFCIRECLKNKEGYDDDTKINPFESLKMHDLGELEVVPGSYELTAKRIRDTVRRIFQLNSRILLITLGGEHLITLPIIESFTKEFDLIQFDAHADLRQHYLQNKYVHNTWAFHAKKMKNCRRFIQVGVRVLSEYERKIHIDKDIRTVREPIYITFDLDVLDPSIAPEVGNPESNGLLFDDIVKVIKELCRKEIVGLDIVECCAKSPLDMTANIASELILKFLSYYKKFHR